MNLGLHHDRFSTEEAEHGMLTDEWATVERVIPKEINEICSARNMTRTAFLQTLAFPRPTRIQNLVFCAELRSRFGQVIAPGFTNGIFELSKSYGLYVPIKRQGEIVELKFFAMRELLKPKVNCIPAQAAA